MISDSAIVFISKCYTQESSMKKILVLMVLFNGTVFTSAVDKVILCAQKQLLKNFFKERAVSKPEEKAFSDLIDYYIAPYFMYELHYTSWPIEGGPKMHGWMNEYSDDPALIETTLMNFILNSSAPHAEQKITLLIDFFKKKYDNSDVPFWSSSFVKEMMIEAAGHGHIKVVNYFLKAGVPKDSVDRDGRTALFQAVNGGHLPMVEVLFGKAVEDVADRRGVKAIDLARDRIDRSKKYNNNQLKKWNHMYHQLLMHA